jgi:hypothetical protein
MRASVLFICVGLIGACGESGEATGRAPGTGPEVEDALEEASDVLEEAREGSAQASNREPDPCDLLTEEVVRRVFELPAETAVTNNASTFPRPLCTYVWEKPNAAEIAERVKARQQEQIQEMMRQVRRGKAGQGLADLATSMESTDARVSLNYAPPSDSTEQARHRFDSARQVLRDGISRRVQTRHHDEEITFQADQDDVEGIGDAAWWAPSMRQLAVLDGPRILYLSVEIESDQNLEHAKRLARVLLE